MARLATWAVLAVVAGALVGCGAAKELPDVIPKTADTGDKPTAVPKTSEPAAKEYVAKVVNAYTGGKPELVAKGRVSRAVLKGQLYKQGGTAIETERSISAVWPDRYVDIDRQQMAGQKTVVAAYLHRPNFFLAQDGRELSVPNMAESQRNFIADVRSEHWMALHLPLTDPKAVVYDLRPGTFLPVGSAQAVPVQTLKVALDDTPPYQLSFDAKSDLLVRVEYSYSQLGTVTRQMWTLSAHKAGPEGLLLPTKLEFRLNSTVAEEWTAEKWEFPDAISDAEFSPPKK